MHRRRGLRSINDKEGCGVCGKFSTVIMSLWLVIVYVDTVRSGFLKELRGY